jgi:5-methylcytosine-specific restriction endonuclease McrA
MNKISESQKKKNAAISKIKAKLIEESDFTCRICSGHGNQAAHLLPKGEFPQYYTEPRNIVILCFSCHYKYDNEILFRKQQETLKSQCFEFAFECDVNKYFNL